MGYGGQPMKVVQANRALLKKVEVLKSLEEVMSNFQETPN